MYPQIELIKTIRTWLLNLIEDLSVEQMNEIPGGFNNNIIWNVAHLLAAQQGVCYLRAGLKPAVEEKYVIEFKSDTKPGALLVKDEIEMIKALLFTSLDQLEIDLKDKIFINYKSWATRYGAEMNNIEDALNFLPFHEGLHIGYVMALKRVIK
ncbi:MAG: DinB family protein [Ferruginibacter sp.]